MKSFSLLRTQKGFTLIEIFIAFSLFAIFAAVFLETQSQNVYDSMQMGQELILKSLCEGKINEVIIDPPEFTNSLDGKKDTKAFDIKGYENYQYTLEFKKFNTPDLTSLMGGENKEEMSDEEKKQVALLKTVFESIQKEIEKVFWQVRVTVENKDDGRMFELSTWFVNPNQKIELNIPMLNAAPATNTAFPGNSP